MANTFKNSNSIINSALAERTFDVPLDCRVRKVIALALFTEDGPDTGTYCLRFTIEGQTVPTMQPDKMHYSRAEAKKTAERAFTSGEVEALVEKKIKEWIFLQ